MILGVSSILYQKILKLSQKSLATTASGKLTTLVSGELQTIEKSLHLIIDMMVLPITLLAWFGYFGAVYYEVSIHLNYYAYYLRSKYIM